MPRYLFHLHSDPNAMDEEGRELPDVAAAREYAMEAARDMVCADIKQGWLNLDHSIEVVDDQGMPLFTITFREAFEIR